MKISAMLKKICAVIKKFVLLLFRIRKNMCGDNSHNMLNVNKTEPFGDANKRYFSPKKRL